MTVWRRQKEWTGLIRLFMHSLRSYPRKRFNGPFFQQVGSIAQNHTLGIVNNLVIHICHNNLIAEHRVPPEKG